MTAGTNTKQYNQVPQYQNLMGQNGKIATPWYRFFTNLLSGVPPQDVSGVSPTGSPFAYQLPRGGTVAIHGGTVSDIELSRDGINQHNAGQTSGCITLSSGDIITITYSAAPTINFFPL